MMAKTIHRVILMSVAMSKIFQFSQVSDKDKIHNTSPLEEISASPERGKEKFHGHAITVMYIVHQLLLEPAFHGKYFLPTKESNIYNYRIMEQNLETKNELNYGCPKCNRG